MEKHKARKHCLFPLYDIKLHHHKNDYTSAFLRTNNAVQFGHLILSQVDKLRE